MKLLRIWFVVLLAVLLPIRGAMAATMLCAPNGAPSPAELNLQSSEHAMEHRHHGDHDDGVHADDATVHDHHGGDSGPGHDHSSQKCNMCSASCSVPPVPSTSTGLYEPVVLTAVSFPNLSAPAPTFQSDRQERPPRTI